MGSAENLAAALKKRDMSRRQLARRYAERVGITEAGARSAVSRWLRAEHVPNEETAIHLGAILDWPYQDFTRVLHLGHRLTLRELAERVEDLFDRVAQIEQALQHPPAGRGRPR